MFALTYCFDPKINKILMIKFKNKITLIIYYLKHRINVDNYIYYILNTYYLNINKIII